MSKIESEKIAKIKDAKINANLKHAKNVKRVLFGKKFFIYKSNDPRFTQYPIKHLYYKEKIKESKQFVEKKTKKKKYWNWIFLGINVIVLAIVLIIQTQNDNLDSFSEFIRDIKWPYLLLTVGVALLAMILDVFKFFQLIYKTTRRKRFALSYKLMALGKYYDVITPFATGEQPFQIYYLNKRGVKGDVATSIPLMKFVFWQISYVAVGLIFLLTNITRKSFATIAIAYNTILVTAWIVVGVNALILSLVLLLSTNKKLGSRIVIGILKLLSKMRIIKNYQATFRKVMRFVVSYQQVMRYLSSSAFTIVYQLVLGIVEILVFNSIPYFLALAFGSATVTLSFSSWVSVVAQVYICTAVINILPTPGGTGAAEVLFATVFNELFGGKIIYAMLMWRILTYYIHLLHGICIIIYDSLIGNKKAERKIQAGYYQDTPREFGKKK